MFNGIYSSATALNAASWQHETVANNLANLNVAGFRRSLLVLQQREGGQASANPGSPINDIRGNEIIRSVIDFSPGAHRHTGRSLDVAIQGDGFFVVQGPDSVLYTRNGSFQVADDRTLVTANGYPVLNNGTPLQLPPDIDASSLVIGSDGSIRADNTPIGKLELVDIDDRQALTPHGSAQFAGPPGLATAPSDSTLVQGSLEMANTQGVAEMIQLIVASRQFESAQRALRTISDSIEQFTNMDR